MAGEGVPGLPEQLTALQGMAFQQFELYLTWLRAGFTPEQAIYLLAAALGGKIVPPGGEEPGSE